MTKVLSENEIKVSLKLLNEMNPKINSWHLEQGYLACELKFKNFVDAFAYMTKVALLAEKANHHPDWFNSYNQININLRTHSDNGITEKDFKLASEMTKLF